MALRISAITIFKDEERFLPEAIDSVLSQTYAAFEYFLVDDGSTDGSSGYARAEAQRHRHVHYLDHPGHLNRGMSASRNLGLAAAGGDLIAFIDADDVWAADKLAEQTRLFAGDEQLAMVYGAPLYWYSWTGRLEDSNRDHLQEMAVSIGDVFEPRQLLERFLRVSSATPCTCDLMVRRSVALSVGGFAAEFPGLFEDQVFCVKVAAAGRIRIGPSGLSRYRQRTDSYCARAWAGGDHAKARRDFLEWVREYLVTTGAFHAEIGAILDAEVQRVTPRPLPESYLAQNDQV